MKNVVCIAVYFSFLCTWGACASEMRTWTSAAGQHKIEAAFVKISDDGKAVTLLKTDGKESTIELAKLSTADQQYVKRQKEAVHSPKEPVQVPARNQSDPSVSDPPRAPAKNSAPSNQPPQASEQDKALLRKKVDAVNIGHDGKATVVLSDEEKEAVVQYLILAERTLKRKYSEQEFSLILMRLERYKKGDHDFEIAELLGRGVTNAKIKYDVIDSYVACLAARSAAFTISGYAATSSINARTERDRYGTQRLNEKSAGASAAAGSARSETKVIESLLPECNRLSGNAHDEEEKARTGKKQRETEKKQLFSN